uniref:Uncharacterized protein n=1 Tax=Nicotiana sylvestris TaxID=4096 RepID=A0A1U7XSN6_NICSY|nr:PREDICTED: putative protein TPRXL [Nicotiana sylvestris]
MKDLYAKLILQGKLLLFVLTILRMTGNGRGNNDSTGSRGREKTPGLSSQGHRTIRPVYSPAASRPCGSQPSASHGSHPSMSHPHGSHTSMSQPLGSQTSVSQPLVVHQAMSQSQGSQPSSSATPSISGKEVGASNEPRWAIQGDSYSSGGFPIPRSRESSPEARLGRERSFRPPRARSSRPPRDRSSHPRQVDPSAYYLGDESSSDGDDNDVV